MLEAKSLRKAEVPLSLIENPSPGNIQSTRLALHVNEDGCSCFVYIASGCHLYKLQVMMDDWFVSEGKDSLLIPEQTPVMDSSMLNRCPHRSEVQSIALAETDSSGYMVLGSVDSYGHLIVSKLDTSGKGLHIQYCLRIVVLEKVVGQGFASVQVNGPWQLLHVASAKALMFMTKISIFGLYVLSGIRHH